MDVTTSEVRDKKFHDQWRGYNQEEVDDFLDRVAETLNHLERENSALAGRIRDLDEQVEVSRSTEDMLKKTLVSAQKAAEEAIAEAKAKAHELITEAETRAAQVKEELKQRTEQTEAELRHKTEHAEEDVRQRTAQVEAELRARQSELDASVEHLRQIEGDTKERLRLFFEQQLASLDRLQDRRPVAAPEPQVEETPQQENFATVPDAGSNGTPQDGPYDAAGGPVSEGRVSEGQVSEGHDAEVEAIALENLDDRPPLENTGELRLDGDEDLADFSPVDDDEHALHGARRKRLGGLFRREGDWSQDS